MSQSTDLYEAAFLDLNTLIARSALVRTDLIDLTPGSVRNTGEGAILTPNPEPRVPPMGGLPEDLAVIYLRYRADDAGVKLQDVRFADPLLDKSRHWLGSHELDRRRQALQGTPLAKDSGRTMVVLRAELSGVRVVRPLDPVIVPDASQKDPFSEVRRSIGIAERKARSLMARTGKRHHVLLFRVPAKELYKDGAGGFYYDGQNRTSPTVVTLDSKGVAIKKTAETTDVSPALMG